MQANFIIGRYARAEARFQRQQSPAMASREWADAKPWGSAAMWAGPIMACGAVFALALMAA